MRRLKIAAGVAAVLAILAAIGWIVVLPWWLRKRIVEEADARGVQLQLGSVSVGWSSATVTGVTASAQKVPGVTVMAGRVDVALERFEPVSIAIANASVDIDGKAGDVVTAIEKFLASQPTGTGTAKKAPPMSMQNARIEWRRAFGDATALHVGDFGGDVKGDPMATDVNVHFGGVTVDIGVANNGPWSGTLTRDKEKSEVAIALSPKGASVAEARVTRMTGVDGFEAKIAVNQLVRFQELGFSKVALGLVGFEEGAILVDASHGEANGSGHGTVRKLRLQGVRLSKAQAATVLDVADLAYSGPLDRMPIAKGRVGVGPLSGPVDGIIGRPPNGLTIQAHTKTDVMKCSDAAKMQASEMIGSEAVGLLSGVLGVDRQVGGTVTADANWTFDSRDPAASSLKIVPSATCDLSFLPR